MPQIRIADHDDCDSLANVLLKLANYHRQVDTTPYSQGLPKTQTEMRALAQRFIDRDKATALIAENNGVFQACLLAEIGPSSMPSSSFSAVGHIQFAWVEEGERGSGLLSGLVTEIEAWCKRQGIAIIELAYMTANQTAVKAWAQLGYQPFRTFAYKELPI